MFLRSSVLFVNCFQSSQIRAACQLSRNTSLIPKLRVFQGHFSHRSILHSSSRFRRGIGQPPPPTLFSYLRAPLLFTAATGTACLLGHQYFGKVISPQSRRPGSIFEWWHIQPDWFKTFWVICGSCIVVFSAYRLAILSAETYPAFLNFMEKYCVTKGKPGSVVEACAQLVLSSFCHISPVHLAINMYIFHTVAKTIVPEIGKDKFLGCYLFSAVVAGFTSMCHQLITGRINGAVGASGAILGLLGGLVYRHPEYEFHIIFLPMIQFNGPTLFGGLVALDLLGLIRGWRVFDHAGHLGGLLSGLMFAICTKEEPRRSSILSWANMRRND